jgi:hypothetical protein
MAYFHVRLTVAGESRDEVKLDLDDSQLDQQFLSPYRAGRPIMISGRAIEPGELQRIRISKSEEPARDIETRIEAHDRASPVYSIGGPSMAWRIANSAPDVTDDYVLGPPGYGDDQGEDTDPVAAPSGPGDTRSTFLVHGRDSQNANAMRAFLRSFGLRVVEWEHAVSETGSPSPYIGDVVQAGLRLADAMVVLFTADDLVRLRPDLLTDRDGPDERNERGQPRANVLYEAGMAEVIAPNRTVMVALGAVKLHSDISGRHLIWFDGDADSRHRLVGRLQLAGLTVDTVGSDWLTAGEFLIQS